ncbi:hypothetical protein [Altererythrobacter sp. Root672]|uniref:hypothetical protein n=1 Tax=Altererythrobacter sp. Root672 TaxID=1736584 RepID=UPI0006F7E04B|nr:hypothetical protein [Altererythrobacter sp. Root672]KRA82954.1 hypothetical protein ASD76_02385 [Altererythrobacter sp. Root672]
MLRRTLIAAAASATFVAGAAHALPMRVPSSGPLSAEQLDSTSTWVIVGAVVGLLALILFLGDSDDDLIPVSP